LHEASRPWLRTPGCIAQVSRLVRYVILPDHVISCESCSLQLTLLRLIHGYLTMDLDQHTWFTPSRPVRWTTATACWSELLHKKLQGMQNAAAPLTNEPVNCTELHRGSTPSVMATFSSPDHLQARHDGHCQCFGDEAPVYLVCSIVQLLASHGVVTSGQLPPAGYNVPRTAMSGRANWNSLSPDLSLLTLSLLTFVRHLKAYVLVLQR